MTTLSHSTKKILLALIGATSLAAVGCAGLAAPTSEKVRNTKEGKACPKPEALIDDGEDAERTSVGQGVMHEIHACMFDLAG